MMSRYISCALRDVVRYDGRRRSLLSKYCHTHTLALRTGANDEHSGPQFLHLSHRSFSLASLGGTRMLCTTTGHSILKSQSVTCPVSRQFGLDTKPTNYTSLDESNIADFLDKYDTFMLDCDGVLWDMDTFTPIPGTGITVNKLRALGKRVLFVTNNSIHSNSHYVEKFNTLANFDAPIESVFGVAYAAAYYLKHIAQVTGKVYVIGTEGMKEEMDKLGIQNLGVGPDPDPASYHPDDIRQLYLDPDVQSVLIGFDEHFSYNKIAKACSYLSNKDVPYFATNEAEMGIMISPTHFQPVTGTLVSTITMASKRQPTVIGKPHVTMFDCIRYQYKDIDPVRTIMVGDSVKADIKFAHNIGVDSLLVFTGAIKREHLKDQAYKVSHVGDLRNLGAECVPTYVLNSLVDLGKYM